MFSKAFHDSSRKYGFAGRIFDPDEDLPGSFVAEGLGKVEFD